MRTLHRAVLTAVTLTATATALLAACGTATAAAVPRPFVYANPNPTGNGSQITVAGGNFCTDPACSPVTVTVAQQQVATDVPVKADGAFGVDFRVDQPPGDYQVTATQHTPAGDKFARTVLHIPPMDFPPSATSGVGTGSHARAADGGRAGTGSGWIWFAVTGGLLLLALGAGAARWRARGRRSAAVGD